MRRTERQCLTATEARQFLDAARGDRLEALYVLALATGMRQGELLGLRWRAVDLERGVLHVTATLQKDAQGKLTFGQPKTHRSKRQVRLIPSAVAALRAHHARQAEERLRAGAAWTDHDLVFCNQVGGPLYKSNLEAKSFHPLLKRAGVTHICFHGLRHTAATLALKQGMPVKVISEMLGHASVTITLDIYSHVLPDMQEQWVDAMEAVLSGTH